MDVRIAFSLTSISFVKTMSENDQKAKSIYPTVLNHLETRYVW